MFTASKEKMSEALALVGSCILATHAVPIYQYLLMEGDSSDLWLTGSDGEVTIITSVEVPSSEDFALCIPAKQFIDLVGLLGGDFSVEQADGRALVKHGRARHKIPILPREQYPESPEIVGESLTLAGNLLKRMMEATEIAVDNKPDGKFPAMRGLHVSVSKGWLHVVGLDGVRMAVASTPMTGEFTVVVPHKAVLVFEKFSDGPEPVEIIPQENHVSLRGERGNVISRRLVGVFPDWRLAIPQNFVHQADISVPALILAIRRVGLASNIRDSAHSPAFSLKFTFSATELKIEGQSPEKGEGTEYIDISCPTLEQEMVIGVAGRQVLDFLSVVQTGHLLLDFRDAVTGLQFKPKDEFGFQYRYITMPVALRW